MSVVLFLDLDDTVVKQGTREELHPGITFDLVRARTALFDVYFFSCWAFTQSDIDWLKEQFPLAKGFIRKPFADEYRFIDDKLNQIMSGKEL